MNNQLRQQTEFEMKRNFSGKLKRILMVLGSIVCLLMLLCKTFKYPTSSRPSTQEEIAKQTSLQEKWNTDEKNATQKVDSVLQLEKE